jgi:glutamyl-tRNA synthetase
MQQLPAEARTDMALPYLVKAGLATAADRAKVGAIVRAAGDRIKVAGDVLDYRDFFTPDDQLAYDEAVFDKRLRKPPDAAPLLRKFRGRLAEAPGSFDATSLEALASDFVQAEGVKLTDVVHAIRVAVTGKAVGFGLWDALAILGKEHSLARIDRALARLG